MVGDSAKGLVSVVMPCFNGSAFIAEAIQSVVKQTYVNWELIIVDDCSSDDSVDKIKTLIRNDKRIILLQNEFRKGVSDTRNAAITYAKGAFIAFLDCDDLWHQRKLEQQLQFLQEHQLDIAFSAYNQISANNALIKKIEAPEFVSYKSMLKKSEIGMLTLIYRVERLGKLYFENCGHEDYLYKLQLLKLTRAVKGDTTVLASYRIHSSSLSRNKIKAAMWRWKIYRKHEKLGLLSSTYFFLWYAFTRVFS